MQNTSMDPVNGRVMEVIRYYELSKSAFAQRIGVSPPVITHISSGRNKVGLDVIQKILEAFHELSPAWLVLGDGEMLATEDRNLRLRYLKDLEILENRIKSVETELSITRNTLESIRKKA